MTWIWLMHGNYLSPTYFSNRILNVWFKRYNSSYRDLHRSSAYSEKFSPHSSNKIPSKSLKDIIAAIVPKDPKPGSTSEPEVERQALAPYEYFPRALENYINFSTEQIKHPSPKQKSTKGLLLQSLQCIYNGVSALWFHRGWQEGERRRRWVCVSLTGCLLSWCSRITC